MGAILDLVLGGKSKPVASTVAADTITADAKKAKKSRAQVLATMGGVAGQELLPDQVSGGPNNKDTVFGN